MLERQRLLAQRQPPLGLGSVRRHPAARLPRTARQELSKPQRIARPGAAGRHTRQTGRFHQRTPAATPKRRHVPRHRRPNPLGEAVAGDIAEQAPGLADVGLRVANVAGRKSPCTGAADARRGAVEQAVAQQSRTADSAMCGRRRRRCRPGSLPPDRLGRRRQQIGLHGVVDVTEIAAGFAVAVDRTVS
jgi:hypothetical protein